MVIKEGMGMDLGVKMKSKLRPRGRKFDGKSRVSNDLYRKNYDEIFKKKLDFYEETQKEKKELEETYQESLRQTKERKEKDGS